MRQFFIFKIKEELAILMKKNPYHLYRTLEQIYYVDQNDLELGVDLFERIIEKEGMKLLAGPERFDTRYQDYIYNIILLEKE